jgi:uncharacterized repeat protein (TIGR03847 family)
MDILLYLRKGIPSMPRIEIDMNPVDALRADAIGKPGKRVFYLQGEKDGKFVTLLVEKIQLQTLALGTQKFFAELSKENSELPAANATWNEKDFRLTPPLDPLFRIGEIDLAYDPEPDLICLVCREILLEGNPPEDAGVVRFWCTRDQLQALALWSLELAGRGLKTCPTCGQPMDPDGHLCPKKNGHKKK